MNEITQFSPHLLNNFYGLKAFLNGNHAALEVKELAKNPKLVKFPTTNSPYFNRWQVMWICVKYPFEAIFSIYCRTVSFVLNSLYLQKPGQFFAVLARQMTRDWEQLCDSWNAKTPLLMPSLNEHQFTSWDLYGHGALPARMIKDEVVHPLTFQSKELRVRVKRAMGIFFEQLVKARAGFFGSTISNGEKKLVIRNFRETYASEGVSQAISELSRTYAGDSISVPLEHLYEALIPNKELSNEVATIPLYAESGVCRGSSIWFIHLYFKTLDSFKDPKHHLIALASQFKTGAPSQAGLLQALSSGEKLLELEKQKMKTSKVSLYELDSNLDSANKKINSLPNGIYRVGAYRHSMVFVKYSQKESYVWDPDFGLFAMNGDEMLQMIQKHHYKPGDIESHIYFHKYNN